MQVKCLPPVAGTWEVLKNVASAINIQLTLEQLGG